MTRSNFLIAVILLTIYTDRPAMSLGTYFGIDVERKCHNFAHESWLIVSEICSICHVRHNKNTAIQRYMQGLRWNKQPDTFVYTLYHSSWSASYNLTRDSNLISSTGRQGNLPDGLSKICLSCHDGIVAPDFQMHHFVSVLFDRTATSLRDPLITEMGISGTISEVLDNGIVQCTSCHDVHGKESADNTRLLRVEKKKICSVCHPVDLSNVKIKERELNAN